MMNMLLQKAPGSGTGKKIEIWQLWRKLEGEGGKWMNLGSPPPNEGDMAALGLAKLI